jgi:hypothetical protein
MGKAISSAAGISLALILSSAFSLSFAADSERQYQVRSIDKVESCGGLNGALAKAKNEDDWGELYGFSLYTMGYLTGINRLASDTYDIAGSKNTKTLMVWLEKYCKEHPEDSFDDALYSLIAELYPNRITAAPE